MPEADTIYFIIIKKTLHSSRYLAHVQPFSLTFFFFFTKENLAGRLGEIKIEQKIDAEGNFTGQALARTIPLIVHVRVRCLTLVIASSKFTLANCETRQFSNHFSSVQTYILPSQEFSLSQQSRFIRVTLIRVIISYRTFRSTNRTEADRIGITRDEVAQGTRHHRGDRQANNLRRVGHSSRFKHGASFRDESAVPRRETYEN